MCALPTLSIYPLLGFTLSTLSSLFARRCLFILLLLDARSWKYLGLSTTSYPAYSVFPSSVFVPPPLESVLFSPTYLRLSVYNSFR
ncbi:hypothetical protein C8R43DRAFT_642273 [Mycena crocata]|nr:hypothetical protein C8R43DRAFT_642273 [Mycena crocata]